MSLLCCLLGPAEFDFYPYQRRHSGRMYTVRRQHPTVTKANDPCSGTYNGRSPEHLEPQARYHRPANASRPYYANFHQQSPSDCPKRMHLHEDNPTQYSRPLIHSPPSPKLRYDRYAERDPAQRLRGIFTNVLDKHGYYIPTAPSQAYGPRRYNMIRATGKHYTYQGYPHDRQHQTTTPHGPTTHNYDEHCTFPNMQRSRRGRTLSFERVRPGGRWY